VAREKASFRLRHQASCRRSPARPLVPMAIFSRSVIPVESPAAFRPEHRAARPGRRWPGAKFSMITFLAHPSSPMWAWAWAEAPAAARAPRWCGSWRSARLPVHKITKMLLAQFWERGASPHNGGLWTKSMFQEATIMRFDGHVQITQQAIRILINLSKRKDVIWPAPTSKVSDASTFWGHWFGVLDYVSSPSAGLPELVAGVSDITIVKSHFKQNLQRLHFMRATEETELVAYRNGVNFIVREMDAWILARTESFWERWGRTLTRTVSPSVLEKGILVDAHLAQALHCIQDSFSSGHVLRSEMVLGTSTKNAGPACYGSAPPIRRIFDYNHPHDDEDIEAKLQHDDEDYYAGSLGHAAANAASYASADLIQIGLNSIATRRGNPTNWNTFTSRWLTHRFWWDVAPSKIGGGTDIDTLLQRTCSPSKVACGRCAE
jgi:hypothetical protein